MLKSKFHKILATLALVTSVSFSSWAEAGVISIETPTGRVVTATAINDNIIKVSNVKKGETIPQSQSAILKPGAFNGKIAEQGPVKMLTSCVMVISTPFL